METPINIVPPSSSPNSPPQGPPLHPCDQIEAPSTVSPLHQPINDEIGNQKKAVELHAIAKDFPNLMKFTATPALLDLCIMDSLMPSPRFMQKMTQDEDITTPPSSIKFADEALMQAGTPSPVAGVKQQPLQTVISPNACTTSVAVTLTNSGIKQGAWSKPLQIAGLSPPLINSVNRFSALSAEWPDLSGAGSNVKNNKSSTRPIQPGVKQMEVPPVFSHENSSFIPNDQEYPWAARMKGKCNLHRVTNPSYMEDGTPLVSIPSHILLEGVENQKEYVVGQFYRCLVPAGGQTHAVINRLWGRKGRIFTRKLGEFSYLFHIPDEQTRNWVLQRGLWHVDDCLMFVSPWSPSETISLPAISTVPVWLTLKNIPNQLYSFKGIDWIASGIGAPMLSSKPWLDPTQMGEAKILVEVKLSKPFPQKVALKDKSGSITMVDVIYSWLPPKCPTCGQLGHKASRCLGLLSDDPTASLITPASSEVPSTTTTRVTSVTTLPKQHLNSESTVCTNDIVNHPSDILFKPSAKEPIIEVPNSLITKSLTPLATQTATQAPTTAPTETALPSEVITEVNVSSETALFSVEEPTLIQSASVKDGNATTILQDLPTVPVVTNSNPFSILDTHNDVPDESDVLESEEVDKGDRIITMETRELPSVPETLQDEEEDGPRSRVGRPLKPTQKIQEQWITVGGRGNRGRRGRGGRGLFT